MFSVFALFLFGLFVFHIWEGLDIPLISLVLQIIERSLPKKQKIKKDPSVIEREEMEKIGKIWVNIVRRDLPKHHRNFTAFHRKQLIDAKRFSETCQREACIIYFLLEFGNLVKL